MSSLANELFSSFQPVGTGRQVGCWVKDCTIPADWLVKFSRPVLGTPLIALCDAHLYAFETSTTTLP
jgi:hypothetical protein